MDGSQNETIQFLMRSLEWIWEAFTYATIHYEMKQRHRVTWKDHICKSLFNIPISPHSRFSFEASLCSTRPHPDALGPQRPKDSPAVGPIDPGGVVWERRIFTQNQPWQRWLLMNTGSIFWGELETARNGCPSFSQPVAKWS